VCVNKILSYDNFNESNDSNNSDSCLALKSFLKNLNKKENFKAFTENYYTDRRFCSNNSFANPNEVVAFVSCKNFSSNRHCEFRTMPAKERAPTTPKDNETVRLRFQTWRKKSEAKHKTKAITYTCLFCPASRSRARNLKKHMCKKHNCGSDSLKEGEKFSRTASYRRPTTEELQHWPVEAKKLRKKRVPKATITPEYEDTSLAEELGEGLVTVDLHKRMRLILNLYFPLIRSNLVIRYINKPSAIVLASYFSEVMTDFFAPTFMHID